MRTSPLPQFEHLSAQSLLARRILGKLVLRVLGRVCALSAVALVGAATEMHAAERVAVASLQADGSVAIAGRNLRCGSVRSALDSRLPNLGVSIPDKHLLVINPSLLRRQPETVRLFVFHHECGHHHVGGSEMGADCWAVRRGVLEGWLDRTGLGQVCKSFGNAPDTPTHPSAARRCGNLDKCFASATTLLAQQEAAKATAAAQQAAPGPSLVIGPTLVRTGVVR